MAAKIKKGKVLDKWRRKRYFSMLAPKIFQERELGQTMAYEPNELQGRCISTNLMMITGNIKRQHINMTFRVNKVQGDTAFTIVDKYEIVPAAIKRKVRRQKDRIDSSFQCVTKDNKLIRMKPMLITSSKVSKAVRAALRKAMVQAVLSLVRANDYDTVIIDMISEKLQRDIWGAINRISPVKSVDIRVMKYIGEFTGKFEIPAFAAAAKKEELKEEAEEVEESTEEEKPTPTAEEPEEVQA